MNAIEQTNDIKRRIKRTMLIFYLSIVLLGVIGYKFVTNGKGIEACSLAGLVLMVGSAVSFITWKVATCAILLDELSNITKNFVSQQLVVNTRVFKELGISVEDVLSQAQKDGFQDINAVDPNAFDQENENQSQ